MMVARLDAPALVLVSVRALALGPEECERWIGQLRDEASNTISSDDEREAVLRRLDEASLDQKGTTLATSAKRLDEFQRKAARLKAAGKLSDSDGVRLQTLAEAARRCVTRLSDLQQGSE